MGCKPLDRKTLKLLQEKAWPEDNSSRVSCTSGCGVCGGAMVFIRGRCPGTEQRKVCPTCMAEIIDDIKERLSDGYGVAMQST